MLKLLNVNGYASLLCGSNYTGPKIETTSGSGESVEAFLSDARGPTLPDKKQLVRQVRSTHPLIDHHFMLVLYVRLLNLWQSFGVLGIYCYLHIGCCDCST